MEETKGAFFYILRFALFALVLSASTLACGSVFRACGEFPVQASAALTVAPADIVIDAGHGGVDVGASGSGGELEKEINLAVAEIMRDLCKIAGYSTAMTRTGDYMLSDGREGTNKMRDLRSRLAITEENPFAVFVSIHTNKFSDSRYWGLQVYYSPHNERSQNLARLIQESAKQNLAPENGRKIKNAQNSIYLLDRIKQPAVMVECGFLSNENETELLMRQQYRKNLAASILAGVIAEMTPVKS